MVWVTTSLLEEQLRSINNLFIRGYYWYIIFFIINAYLKKF